MKINRGITLDEARQHIGAAVVYDPGYGPKEDGIIVRVNDSYVFVWYGIDDVKATRPSDLVLLDGPA